MFYTNLLFPRFYKHAFEVTRGISVVAACKGNGRRLHADHFGGGCAKSLTPEVGSSDDSFS